MADLEALEELVGGDAFVSNAFLLLGEDLVADPVLIMGGQQFSFLVVEPDDLGAGSVGLFVGEGGESVEVGVDGWNSFLPRVFRGARHVALRSAKGSGSGRSHPRRLSARRR